MNQTDKILKAIQVLNKAIELAPENADAYNERGIAKGKLDDHRGAIQDFDKAIELDSKNYYPYLLKGFEEMSLGDKEGACLTWSKISELCEIDAYWLVKEFCD